MQSAGRQCPWLCQQDNNGRADPDRDQLLEQISGCAFTHLESALEYTFQRRRGPSTCAHGSQHMLALGAVKTGSGPVRSVFVRLQLHQAATKLCCSWMSARLSDSTL